VSRQVASKPSIDIAFDRYVIVGTEAGSWIYEIRDGEAHVVHEMSECFGYGWVANGALYIACKEVQPDEGYVRDLRYRTYRVDGIPPSMWTMQAPV
jgi:hypothetical protein